MYKIIQRIEIILQHCNLSLMLVLLENVFLKKENK